MPYFRGYYTLTPETKMLVHHWPRRGLIFLFFFSFNWSTMLAVRADDIKTTPKAVALKTTLRGKPTLKKVWKKAAPCASPKKERGKKKNKNVACKPARPPVE